MRSDLSRRQWLATAGAVAGVTLASRRARSAAAPSAKVTVSRCPTYGPEIVTVLEKMMDQLGGLGGLVKNKTVAVKINCIGNPWERFDPYPLEDTFWTHPRAFGALVHLLGKAGAHRIRVVEGGMSTCEPLQEWMLSVNWRPQDIANAAKNVEFENTNYLGYGKKYSRMKVSYGGYIFPAFDLNHSYEDCDVFVSFAKLKEHNTTGITLSMKNVYGTTPTAIYGDGVADEPLPRPRGSRVGTFHFGRKQPPKGVPPEKDPTTPRTAVYRIPRIVVDTVGARPVDLALIDGIRTITGGETPAQTAMEAVSPGVLIAGTNCVSTDAVGLAVMGYDPMADQGQEPFSRTGGRGDNNQCDSMLRLAEDVGLGTRDLKKIEVIGTPISEVRFDFLAYRQKFRRQATEAAKRG
ncbi:MAG: DUF362 domain-containing protein [Bryobacteraceae bacterium]